jgi:Na+-driven multidrug efflux pump
MLLVFYAFLIKERRKNMSNKHAQSKNPLTEGAIYKPLLKFMLPVMLAVFLQAMYSAVDLIVIGHLLPENEVQMATSAVGTGSMIMLLLTYVITGLSMGQSSYLVAILVQETEKMLGKRLVPLYVSSLSLQLP